MAPQSASPGYSMALVYLLITVAVLLSTCAFLVCMKKCGGEKHAAAEPYQYIHIRANKPVKVILNRNRAALQLGAASTSLRKSERLRDTVEPDRYCLQAFYFQNTDTSRHPKYKCIYYSNEGDNMPGRLQYFKIPSVFATEEEAEKCIPLFQDLVETINMRSEEELNEWVEIKQTLDTAAVTPRAKRAKDRAGVYYSIRFEYFQLQNYLFYFCNL
jgi:hypothetical protein